MQHDVAIIGAGPAGSTAAKNLALKGFDVLLLDKDKFPRVKPCGGWITPNVLKLLNWNQKELDNIFWSPIKGLAIYSPSYFNFAIKKNQILSYGIIRKEFDNQIKNDAIDAGVTFIEGSKCKNLKWKSQSVQIHTQDDEFKAKMVIGADGTRSKVAELSGIRKGWSSSNIVLDLVSETRIKKDSIKDLYPDDLAFIFYNEGAGYNWIYPKISESNEESFINIGIGCKLSKMKNSREMYFNFIKSLKKINLLPSNIELAKHDAWTYATFSGPKRTFSERVLLIGDAAGFSSNIAGEGIRTGIISGILAAETIAEVEGNYSRDSLKIFQKKWKRELKSEYAIGSALQALLNNEMNSLDEILGHIKNDVETQELLIKLLLVENIDETFTSLMKKVNDF
ncbi:MAG: NAD(P)/FAD-dependent oxidoreductase [Candidatus Helarchaeota archaeon]